MVESGGAPEPAQPVLPSTHFTPISLTEVTSFLEDKERVLNERLKLLADRLVNAQGEVTDFFSKLRMRVQTDAEFFDRVDAVVTEADQRITEIFGSLAGKP